MLQQEAATQNASAGYAEFAEASKNVAGEKEFLKEAGGLEEGLTKLRSQLDMFDPGNAGYGKKSNNVKSKGANQEEEEDDEMDALREKFEAYKMVRRIEPELPPLTPLPPLDSSRRLPDLPLLHFNLSEEALEKFMGTARLEATMKQKLFRQSQQNICAERRDAMSQMAQETYEKVLARKKRQAELVLLARQKGKTMLDVAVPKEVVMERWAVMYAITSFLKAAREEVIFHRKSPEDRLAEIRARQLSGKVKPRDEFHERTIEMDNIMLDRSVTTKLDMLGFMYRSWRKIRGRRDQAGAIAFCLGKWRPRANVLIAFRKHTQLIRQLQAWWRRMSLRQQNLREELSERWDRIEKSGTSWWGPEEIQPAEGTVISAEPADPKKRETFLIMELRARRFFLLSELKMWEEDGQRWQEERRQRKLRKERADIRMLPARPSCLPPNHHHDIKKVCLEGCLGRQGDKEIEAWIKAVKANPKGGGWQEIPQKVANERKGKNSREEADMLAASLFGVAEAEDLDKWGVGLRHMPLVGQKPGADEGEGRFP